MKYKNREVEFKDMPTEAQTAFPFSPFEDYKFLYMPSCNAFRASLVYDKVILKPKIEVFEYKTTDWYLYLTVKNEV